MKNIWLKNKLSIIISGYILFFGAMAYFLVFPLVFRVKYVSDQIQEKIIDQRVEEARLNTLPEMEKDWAYFQMQKSSMDVIMSPGSEISFIESIDSIAQKSGNMIDLKIGDQIDPKEIAKIRASSKNKKEQKGIMDEVSYTNYFPMQINLRGDYKSLTEFIHMLENGRFYVNIISVNSKKQLIEKDSNIINSKKSEEESPKEAIISSINAITYTQR